MAVAAVIPTRPVDDDRADGWVGACRNPLRLSIHEPVASIPAPRDATVVCRPPCALPEREAVGKAARRDPCEEFARRSGAGRGRGGAGRAPDHRREGKENGCDGKEEFHAVRLWPSIRRLSSAVARTFSGTRRP